MPGSTPDVWIINQKSCATDRPAVSACTATSDLSRQSKRSRSAGSTVMLIPNHIHPMYNLALDSLRPRTPIALRISRHVHSCPSPSVESNGANASLLSLKITININARFRFEFGRLGLHSDSRLVGVWPKATGCGFHPMLTRV